MVSTNKRIQNELSELGPYSLIAHSTSEMSYDETFIVSQIPVDCKLWFPGHLQKQQNPSLQLYFYDFLHIWVLTLIECQGESHKNCQKMSRSYIINQKKQNN